MKNEERIIKLLKAIFMIACSIVTFLLTYMSSLGGAHSGTAIMFLLGLGLTIAGLCIGIPCFSKKKEE